MVEESNGVKAAAEQFGEGAGDGQSPIERLIQSDDRTYHQQMGPAASHPSPALSRQDGEMWPILLSAGVGLPVVSIVFKLLTRFCADGYLNPLPTLRVYERVYSAVSADENWTDVSSWYWSALLGRSRGPWWVITTAEREISQR
jgi:hypothetical protein